MAASYDIDPGKHRDERRARIRARLQAPLDPEAAPDGEPGSAAGGAAPAPASQEGTADLEGSGEQDSTSGRDDQAGVATPAPPPSEPDRKTRANSDGVFGYDWDTWDRWCDQANEVLVAVAATGQTITYRDLQIALEERFGSPMKHAKRSVPQLLEYAAERPGGVVDGFLACAAAVPSSEEVEATPEPLLRAAVRAGIYDAADAPRPGRRWTPTQAQQAWGAAHRAGLVAAAAGR